MTVEPKTEYETLIRRADKYIRHPNSSSGTAISRWRNRAVIWLRQQLPDSDLSEEFLMVPAPNHKSERLTQGDVRNVQKSVQVLMKARDLLPFLARSKERLLPKAENLRKVFVVHGHNDALKNNVARLLTKLDLEPIILHEQPNKGRTIIEKFLDYAEVAFALVLLTADDRGGSASEAPETYKKRARQNVILELGFFIGRLGRKGVAAIYEEGVEIPSDYSGVLFIPYDSAGVWQLAAAKEMKAAGVKLDMNRL